MSSASHRYTEDNTVRIRRSAIDSVIPTTTANTTWQADIVGVDTIGWECPEATVNAIWPINWPAPSWPTSTDNRGPGCPAPTTPTAAHPATNITSELPVGTIPPPMPCAASAAAPATAPVIAPRRRAARTDTGDMRGTIPATAPPHRLWTQTDPNGRLARNDQRPLTIPVLMRLAATFDLEVGLELARARGIPVTVVWPVGASRE